MGEIMDEQQALKFPDRPEVWTKQNMFDHVVTCLSIQKRRSMMEGGDVCAYRSKDGLRCAAGHCIPDEDYEEYWDFDFGWSIDRVVSECASLDDSLRLLMSGLQECHDDSRTVEDIQSSLKSTAEDFSLDDGVVGLIVCWA